MNPQMTTAGSVAATFGALWLIGLTAGQAAATLCLLQVASVFSLRFWSNEAGALGAKPLGHLAAAIVAQALPSVIPSAACVITCLAISSSTYFFE